MIQTTVTTMTGLRLALLSSMILTTLLLPGCSKQDDSKGRKSQMAESGMAADVSSVSVDDIQPDATSYDCTSMAGSADKRSWCLGLQAWNDSEYHSRDDRARDEFIEGWRLGSLDAQQAVNPGIEQLQSRPMAAAGYESGYINVLDAIGVIEYECSEGAETDNEYRDRWCEAAAAFNRARLASPTNAVLRGTYINGYMSGRAIALTLPTSMESLFGGEQSSVDGKRAIDEPTDHSPKAIRIFHQGFNDGFQAMLDTVRESVNQVMEQMQNLDVMPGMEGMPDMDGMPPGMMESFDPSNP